METEVTSYEQIQKKKKELAKKISGKTEILAKVSKKYRPKGGRPECDLARDVFYEAIEEYEEGDLTWEEMIAEMSKSLKAIKSK